MKQESPTSKQSCVGGGSVQDFTVKDRAGQDVSLKEYEGKVVARFEPTVDMDEVKAAVAAML